MGFQDANPVICSNQKLPAMILRNSFLCNTALFPPLPHSHYLFFFYPLPRPPPPFPSPLPSQFSVQSMYTGDFLRVNPVKGHVLEASGADPDDWATFHLRTVSLSDPHLHEIRSLDFSYWSLQNVSFPPTSSTGSLDTLAVTSTVSVPGNDGGWEIFKFHFHRAEPTWFMIQAPNGNFLEVDDDGRVTATAPGDRVDTSVSSYWWTRGTTFLLVRRSGVRGEWQLGRYWGQEEAGRQLENHRATWVTEEDFRKLQVSGCPGLRTWFLSGRCCLILPMQ